MRWTSLALSIAGQAVAELAERSRPRSEAWKVYRRRLEASLIWAGLLIGEIAGSHRGLAPTLVASLGVASSRIRSVTGAEELSAPDMLGALCVLQKHGWVPCSMLARLRSTSDKEQAEAIAEEFVKHSRTRNSKIRG